MKKILLLAPVMFLIYSCMFFDSEGAAITITYPKASEPINTTSTLVTGTAIDNIYVKSVEVSVNNGVFSTAMGSESWSAIVKFTSNGTHLLTVKATDSNGNETFANIQVVVDSDFTYTEDQDDPVLTVTNLNNGDTINQSVFTLEGTASDNVELDSVEVSINGGTFVAAQDLEDWAYILNFASSGTYVLTIKAEDTSGNEKYVNLTITVTLP